MIRLIDNQNDFDRDMLLKTLSGKKMLSYLKAYGTDYDFCRFYKLEYDEVYGFMFMINSTLIICSDYDLPVDEILSFIQMNVPFRIEGSQQILKKLFPDALEKLRTKHGSADYRAASPMMRQVLVKTVNEDLSHLLPKVKQETLLIFGRNDDATPITDGQRMEKEMPNAGLAVIENAGHFAFIEQQYLFLRIVDSFLGIE